MKGHEIACRTLCHAMWRARRLIRTAPAMGASWVAGYLPPVAGALLQEEIESRNPHALSALTY